MPSVVYCQTYICWYKFVTVFWVKRLGSITISLFEVWRKQKVRGTSSWVNFYLLNSLPNLKHAISFCAHHTSERIMITIEQVMKEHNMLILVCHPKLNSYWPGQSHFLFLACTNQKTIPKKLTHIREMLLQVEKVKNTYLFILPHGLFLPFSNLP